MIYRHLVSRENRILWFENSENPNTTLQGNLLVTRPLYAPEGPMTLGVFRYNLTSILTSELDQYHYILQKIYSEVRSQEQFSIDLFHAVLISIARNMLCETDPIVTRFSAKMLCELMKVSGLPFNSFIRSGVVPYTVGSFLRDYATRFTFTPPTEYAV